MLYLSIEDGSIVTSTGGGHSSSAVSNLLISPIPRVRSLRNKILQPILKNSGCLWNRKWTQAFCPCSKQS